MREFLRRSGAVPLRIAVGSDVGSRYRANFDTWYVAPDLPFVVVADGMGDGEGSAVASRTAVEVFAEAVRAVGTDVGAGDLRTAVAAAQHQVRQEAVRLGQLTGCTLTGWLAIGGEAWIVQVGDSRAYRLRDGLLEVLTTDHTMAWLGAIYGWYPSGSTQAAAARYQLTRYIGHPASPEPDVLNVSLRSGDVYCVCSDGIADQVSYQQLRDNLARLPDEAAQGLLRAAQDAGGNDNATVAVIAVGDQDRGADVPRDQGSNL